MSPSGDIRPLGDALKDLAIDSASRTSNINKMLITALPQMNLNRKLADTDLCIDLSDEDIRQLENMASTITLTKGDCLFQQHCLAKQMFMMTRGVMLLERSNSEGRRQVMAFIFPGDFLGFTPGSHLDYSAIALTDPVELKAFSRDEITRRGDQQPELRANIAQINNKVLARTLDQVFAIGHKKAHEKICFLLVQIRERYGPYDADYVDLMMTRKDIGDYLGLTLETVSRALAKLKSEGIIRISDNSRIHIVQPNVLNDLASLE